MNEYYFVCGVCYIITVKYDLQYKILSYKILIVRGNKSKSQTAIILRKNENFCCNRGFINITES